MTQGINGNQYTWDGRNHMTAIASNPAASFVYDAFGRRVKKIISGVATQYLYDGLNPVQELNSSNVATANLLTGLNIDEFFSRTDSSGARSFLTDILGNTLALTDSSGTIQTQYTYEPFGNVTVSGAANSNSYQFTGRENDGTGLYFYRARYYSPTFQRFVAQDPIGFGGGDTNFYGYVTNDPTKWLDPLGLARGDWWDPRTYPPIDWYERANDIANQELAQHHGHNDVDDAVRHADWSRRMCEEIGPFTSWSSGVGHELQGMLEGQPMGEMQMDLHNNAVGRAAGEAGTDIDISKLQTSPGLDVTIPYPYK